MNFSIEQNDRATIFRPKEARLDSLIAAELKAEFLILAQADVETLIVDLSEVEYIDSGGLSALLLARRQMVGHQGDVRLVGASDDVRSLLTLTQLDRVLPVYETVDEAIAAPQLSSLSVPPEGGITGAVKSQRAFAAAGAFAGGASALADILMSGDDDEEYDDDDDFEDDDEYYDDDDEYSDEDDEESDDEEEEGEEEDDSEPGDEHVEDIDFDEDLEEDDDEDEDY